MDDPTNRGARRRLRFEQAERALRRALAALWRSEAAEVEQKLDDLAAARALCREAEGAIEDALIGVEADAETRPRRHRLRD